MGQQEPLPARRKAGGAPELPGGTGEVASLPGRAGAAVGSRQVRRVFHRAVAAHTSTRQPRGFAEGSKGRALVPRASPALAQLQIRFHLKLGRTLSQAAAATSAILCHLLEREEEVLAVGKSASAGGFEEQRAQGQPGL